jgi:hypothetical protein
MATSKFAPLVILALVLILAFSRPAHGQLRVVSYNTAGGPRPGMETVLAAIGSDSANGIAKAPDVLALQEQGASASTTQAIVDILNGIYGAGTYSRATLDGGTSGAGRPGLIDNTTTVSFIDQVAFEDVNTSAILPADLSAAASTIVLIFNLSRANSWTPRV